MTLATETSDRGSVREIELQLHDGEGRAACVQCAPSTENMSGSLGREYQTDRAGRKHRSVEVKDVFQQSCCRILELDLVSAERKGPAAPAFQYEQRHTAAGATESNSLRCLGEPDCCLLGRPMIEPCNDLRKSGKRLR
ncbi:hypothetical protein AB7008_08215 [Bradyrhizobium sp. 521_C7_N1_3]|uniref:hypothetical protein n=1 Tax=Bradyrhizobium sp. 521_C7_N1_3 TaxID=3240368 RepID=UPI003F88666A